MSHVIWTKYLPGRSYCVLGGEGAELGRVEGAWIASTAALAAEAGEGEGPPARPANTTASLRGPAAMWDASMRELCEV